MNKKIIYKVYNDIIFCGVYIHNILLIGKSNKSKIYAVYNAIKYPFYMCRINEKMINKQFLNVIKNYKYGEN